MYATRTVAALGLVAGLLTLAACAPSQDDAMPEAGEGAALFVDNCAICHGADGRGADGSGAMPAKGLSPAADLTRLSAGNQGVFPRVHVLSVIDGYNRGALGASRMPEFGGFLGGETVPVALTVAAEGDEMQLTPVPRNLAALVAYLETIQVP
ncbi:c-type cytochrome [Thalassobius sp. Cn5-15]|uniref:c-type cytochrome n=1 Tax=Thalassobius sp. Cn5-15 TaxID=2917763 RepID=UPI001EF224C8|nr:c-type cytochrome [Thalassobius sp. Cn5-15]MCG7493092.1 c-type cytochrome [Thalassobius sp. Cn5-15]